MLESEGLCLPKLEISASASAENSPKPEASAEPAKCEVLPGAKVAVQVTLRRTHVAEGGAGAGLTPPSNNPHGIFEAYWIYVEVIDYDEMRSFIGSRTCSSAHLIMN